MAAPADAHEWVSFEDPDEDRTWLVDVTFLASPWTCIFGAGCQGVLTAPAARLGQGCCSYGAHFSGEDDVARVLEAVQRLDDAEWQFCEIGRRDGVLSMNDTSTTTALVDDACIFLNRPGFAGGAGCAFHIAATRLGIAHRELKPDVCWQLPLRRVDETEPSGHVISKVSEWRRQDWGEAGEEFAWWCTESPAAFVGTVPVIESLEEELLGLVGEKVYRRIRAYFDHRIAAVAILPHPVVRRRRPRAGSR